MAEVVPQQLRWAIVIVDCEPAMGHEQAGQRRAVVVSNEAFHRSGRASVCPISAREPKYPCEVAIPEGMAGQTKSAVILTHQVRTIDLARVRAWSIAGIAQRIHDPPLRQAVRAALAHHLGLDLPDDIGEWP